MAGDGETITKDMAKLKLSLLYGSMVDLPEERKNVVRIFLSSTFTDMTVERNTLMGSIFPKLKEYCRQTYQQEFQVVDMRWGVQDQASDNHSTTELCLREIISCQRESAGPNFVCFLGDRYGTRYLKKTIEEKYWSILAPRITDAELRHLLDIWYKLDGNSATPQRVLQTISSVENGAADFWTASAMMYEAIRTAAVEAKEEGKIPPDVAHQFVRSVTEEEIDNSGMLSDISEQKPRCLAFLRKTNNINMEHVKAKRFTDQSGNVERDAESQDLLKRLKDTVRNKMPADHVKEYSIDWSDKDGINADDHKEYLQMFCDDFYAQVKRLIDSGVQAQDAGSKTVHVDPISREVLTHSKMAQDKLSKVVPRMDILNKIKAYITGDSDRPLVVHGHSGCGKTSVMASVAEQTNPWLKSKSSGKQMAVVLRLLGTTPASSDIELLLASLNSQLGIILAGDDAVRESESSNKSLKDLISDFQKNIDEVGKLSTQLVIVIDSVDQLRKNDAAFNLSWMPEKLPANVKFVISTLPDIYGILESAQRFDWPAKNFVEVKALDEKSAWIIIDKWLEMADRKLSKEQRTVVAKVFKGRSLPPLYIKLVFDIFINWTSYTQDLSLPADVPACMDQLFTNLENTHGTNSVRLSLGYLTCCPGGISQTELEDTLSIDDKYLTVVFQYHIPPIRRIPPTLWVRIKSDIRDHIVEKESNGVAALSWYHRQFVEYATKRYVGDKEHARHCLNTLSDYFTGKWSETPKPFTWTASQMKKLEISDSAASALRYVPAQPTRFGRHTFNARKISVLSQIWSGELMKDLAYQNSARYLMDIEFLTGKFLHDSWANIDSELSHLLNAMEEVEGSEDVERSRFRVECSYLYSNLKMYNTLLSVSPCSLSAQLFNGLQDKYNLFTPISPAGDKLPNITWFLQQLILGAGLDMCPLLPVTKHLAISSMQVLHVVLSGLSNLVHFIYKNKATVAAFCKEMLIYQIEENGSITECATIPLPRPEPEFGTFISLADNENYLFAYSKSHFSLISLEHKRSELHVEIIHETKDNTLNNQSLRAFRNPHINGKDAVLFYTYYKDMVAIYSVKLRRFVWDRRIVFKRDKVDYMIYSSSLQDTDKAHMKSLSIVLTGKTELYQVELLKDGDVKVTQAQTLPNGFVDCTGSKRVPACRLKSYMAADRLHGDLQTDVVIPEPPCNILPISDRESISKNLWSYYGSTSKCEFSLTGRLRSGVDVLAVYSDPDSMLELYSLIGRDKIGHSATIFRNKKPHIVYLVPQSDVLIILTRQTASVYFLTELQWPVIEVVFAYEFEMTDEYPKKMVADPRGYVAFKGRTSSCSFYDLTAFSESDSKSVKLQTRFVQVLCLPEEFNCALTLLDDGDMWDMSTNECLGQLPGRPENVGLRFANSYPGFGKWQLYISIVYGEMLCVIGVNFSAENKKRVLKTEVLHTHTFEQLRVYINYDKGMLLIDNFKGIVYDFKIEQMTRSLGEGHRLSLKPESDGYWSDVDFDAFGYCYGDKVFLVCGMDTEAEFYEDREPCVFVYDSSSYKLLKKIEHLLFTVSTYFKKLDCIVCTMFDSSHHRYLSVFDSTTLTFTDNLFGETFDFYSMMIGFQSEGGVYNTDPLPYLYCCAEDKGIFLKLDISKYKEWSRDIGVTTLGAYTTNRASSADASISNKRGYVAKLSQKSASLELTRITGDKLEFLCDFVFPGLIEMFAFSADDKYIVVVLNSGEVICLNLLDPADPNLRSEVSKLRCTQNTICQTQEEMLTDSRWTSMKVAMQSIGKKRTVDTLYEFMKNYVKPGNSLDEHKVAFPLVGTKQFDKKFKHAVDKKTNKYTPLIKTTPLDFQELLKQQEKEAEEREARERAEKNRIQQIHNECEQKTSTPLSSQPSESRVHIKPLTLLSEHKTSTPLSSQPSESRVHIKPLTLLSEQPPEPHLQSKPSARLGTKSQQPTPGVCTESQNPKQTLTESKHQQQNSEQEVQKSIHQRTSEDVRKASPETGAGDQKPSSACSIL